MSSSIFRPADNPADVFHSKSYVGDTTDDWLVDPDDEYQDPYYDYEEYCSCDDCRDRRSWEFEIQREDWEWEDREREFDTFPIDDFDEVWYLEAEDFGLPAYQPRRKARATTYHQPAEKGWRGRQWARHVRRIERAS